MVRAGRCPRHPWRLTSRGRCCRRSIFYHPCIVQQCQAALSERGLLHLGDTQLAHQPLGGRRVLVDTTMERPVRIAHLSSFRLTIFRIGLHTHSIFPQERRSTGLLDADVTHAHSHVSYIVRGGGRRHVHVPSCTRSRRPRTRGGAGHSARPPPRVLRAGLSSKFRHASRRLAPRGLSRNR